MFLILLWAKGQWAGLASLPSSNKKIKHTKMKNGNNFILKKELIISPSFLKNRGHEFLF